MPPSKQVVDRNKDALSVAASVSTHVATVHKELSAVLSPHLQGSETLPDIALLLSLVGRAIESDASVMVEADTTHQTELADDTAPREIRDETTAVLVSTMVEIREMLEGLLGHALVMRHGIQGSTPRGPAEAAAFAKTLIELLETKSLPAPRFVSSIDRVAMAAELRAKLEPVEVALADVAREEREAEKTLIARDAAMSAFDRTFSRSATALTALFRLAGQDEIAARVRPSGRKPGRLADPEEPTEPNGASEAC